jgi:hypothetical protein
VLLVDCGCEMAMLFHELSMRAPETAAAIQSRARGVSQSRRSSQALLELGFDVSMASHYRLNSACSAHKVPTSSPTRMLALVQSLRPPRDS